MAGGGFGGVKAALELAKDPRCAVTLVSDEDTLTYHPLLYATATGASRKISSIPLSRIFAGTNIRVVKDTIVGIDSSRRLIVGRSRQYEYDAVVFGLGVVTNYFDIPGLAKYSWGIKSPEEIRAFRKHLHDELITTKHFDKHYVIVGAGPTGVELAASLKDYLLKVGRWHGLKQHHVNITLVEAAPRVLPRMSEKTSRAAAKRLRELGVHTLLGTTVKGLDDHTLHAGDRTIATETVVWTSGVTNHPFYAYNQDVFRLSERGFVTVNEHLEAAPGVFVVGDNAATKYAGLAQTAISDGAFVAGVIKSRFSGAHLPIYRPKAPFSVVPVGHGWAALERLGFRLTGKSASWIRKIADLIGYHDLLPLGPAIKLWLSERETEEFGCKLCQKNNGSSRVARNT